MLSYTLIATQLQFSHMLGRCFDIDTIVVVKQSTIANVTMMEEKKRHAQLQGRRSPSTQEECVAYKCTSHAPKIKT